MINQAEITIVNQKVEKIPAKTEIVWKWTYSEYSPKAVINAKWKIVLFFHADWCPSCKSIDNELKNIWVKWDVTILRVNYDDSSNLKQKYEVLAQSTFVEVDNDWNMIKKWVWWKSDDIYTSIN
jgi:thiol-disulfide isomerase/thioredoxin